MPNHRSILSFQFPTRKNEAATIERIREYDKLRRHKDRMESVFKKYDKGVETATLKWTGYSEKLKFQNKDGAKNFSESISKLDDPDITSEPHGVFAIVTIETPDTYSELERLKEKENPPPFLQRSSGKNLEVALIHSEINKVVEKYKSARKDYSKDHDEPLKVPQGELIDEFGDCFVKFLEPFAIAIERGITLVEEDNTTP